MNDIDFLPADYVCKQTTRSNNNWLRGLFVAVLSLMAVGSWMHYKSIQDLTARRNRLRDQAAAMLAQVDTCDQIRLELQRVERSSNLLAGLRSHVPPTRWLTAIVGALPAQTNLTELHAEVDDGTESSVRQDPHAAVPQPPVTAAARVQQDLDRMAKLTARRALSISLRGSADDDLQVSRFLSALHKAELFEQVQLLFTDQQGTGEKMLRTFAIRLRTRPLAPPAVKRPADVPIASQQSWKPKS
ncbi:MAG: PilN domain-containing protein [Planctomycetes bacterium]|nr:PilN domain-containing protein [Planctomycetota bacterium]